MRVTMKDIAEKLGVSVPTVSRALKNQGQIGNKTRKLILKTAQELGYEFREEANRASGKMIGIVFDKRLQSLPTDPFYGIVMMGVEEQCQSYQTQVFFHTIDQSAEDTRLWNLFAEGRLHGLILVGGDISEELVRAVKARNIPFVLVDNALEALHVDAVVTDNAGGVRQVMEHLFQLGHKRIGFVGGPLSHPSLAERYETYQNCLSQANISKQPEWEWIHTEAGPTFQKGYQAIRELVHKGLDVTAILTDNDHTAIGILRGCSELGISVPEQLSIVGFDNVAISEHTSPPLTSVHIHKREMGIQAAKRLHELMDHKDIPIKITLGTELVVRHSSGSCAENTRNCAG